MERMAKQELGGIVRGDASLGAYKGCQVVENYNRPYPERIRHIKEVMSLSLTEHSSIVIKM